MKSSILMLLLYLVFLLSCSKTNHLGSEFKTFVGTWKNINGDLPITIIIDENGKVQVLKSVERGVEFRAHYFRKDSIEESVYFQYTLSKEKVIRDHKYLKFSKTPNNDTLIFDVGTLIESSNSMYQSEIKFVHE